MEADIVGTEAPRATRGDGPDFICIGAQKAGTQWLYDQLAFHPEFWMPPVKELHVFDRSRKNVSQARRLARRVERDLGGVNERRVASHARPLENRDVRFVRRYAKLLKGGRDARLGQQTLDGYAALFDDTGARKSGDVTPAYSRLHDGAVRKVTTRFPEAKVVFIAREPVERLWSAYGMAARKAERLKGEAVSPDSALAFARRPAVAARSYPSEIVSRWKKHAREGQFAWFFFDDLKADPARLRAGILEFLGADPALDSEGLEPGFNRKGGAAKVALTDEIRDALVAHFADEIRRSADILGGAAVEWRRRYGL